MTEPVTLLTDEVQAWVGATAVYTAPEELSRASIRAFAYLGDFPVGGDEVVGLCRSADSVVVATPNHGAWDR